jgi:hypothetical protein
MRLYVMHDDAGEITAIGIPAPEHAAHAGMVATAGHCVVSIEAHEVEHAGHMARCVATHRVDTTARPPRLVRK